MLRLSCKEVAALLVAREDRPLVLAERVALRLHLVVCDACPRFERQINTMRRALVQWRSQAADHPDEAPKRSD